MSTDDNKVLKNYPISKELKSCSHFYPFKITRIYHMCEGLMCRSRGGTGGSGLPLENHKTIGFLSSTGLDPLKITKPPSQYSMLGQY